MRDVFNGVYVFKTGIITITEPSPFIAQRFEPSDWVFFQKRIKTLLIPITIKNVLKSFFEGML